MSTGPAGPKKFLTTQDIDAWLLAAKERRVALHLKAASPWHTYHLHEAFTEMSALLHDALEEVRVVSEQLWERSGQHDNRQQTCKKTVTGCGNRDES
jgi:hypothetical protein